MRKRRGQKIGDRGKVWCGHWSVEVVQVAKKREEKRKNLFMHSEMALCACGVVMLKMGEEE